jgi:hypothetical protein
MAIKSSAGDRVLGFFKTKPNSTFRIIEITSRLTDIKKPVINYWLKQYLRDGSIEKVKYGHYRLNPVPPDIDAIRELALETGKKTIQDHGRLWKPGEEALLKHRLNQPIMATDELLFSSILDRMLNNPDAFSRFDIEFLKSKLPQLIKETVNG